MSDHDQVKMASMDYRKDRPDAENPVKIEDLTLRDGHQSLFATRGRTEDMIPVAEMMDEAARFFVPALLAVEATRQAQEDLPRADLTRRTRT